MKNSKSKVKGMLKGVAAGFALIMCSAFFPANVIAFAQDLAGEDKVNTNTHRIEIGQKDTSYSSTVKKGEPFTIPVGEYYGKSATAKKIGSQSLPNSSILVTYSATGEEIVSAISGKNDTELAGLTFTAEKLGTYKITYKVIEHEKEYTYDLTVECQASEAAFEFLGNDANLIPSVYDTKLAKNKDIVLPLPIVNDEDGEKIMDNDDNSLYVTDRTGSGIDDDQHYVYVSVTNGSEKVSVVKDETDGFLYIDGETLTQNAEELDGQELKITYSFYQKKKNKPVYITSTSKTFTVRDGYFYKDSDAQKNKDNTKRGFDLDVTLSTTPDSAVVGSARALPTVTAKTKVSNAPAGENIEVYYDIKVEKMDDNGKYTIPVNKDEVIKDNKFTAKEEGSYKFTYIVKDFYNDSDENAQEVSFTIDKVKDTQAASVFMYDAGDYTVDDEGNYSSAESKLKTQTDTRNIVMYAVGGNDNMVAKKDLTLRREVRDGSGIKRFVIGEKDYQNIEGYEYNNYNLIFAPNKGVSSSVYTQIVNDNYEIYKQMVVDKNNQSETDTTVIDPTNADSVKAWLKANNYKLVTTKYNQDVDGNEIISDAKGSADDISQDDIKAMIDAGYIYIPSESTNRQYDFKEETYNFYYFACDNVNNNRETSKYYTVKLVENSSDSSIPTLDFVTTLQDVYLPDETIEFKVATASDSIDSASRLDVTTAYRYLSSYDGTTRTPVTHTSTSSTLTYVIAGQVSTKDQNKWYVTSKDSKTGLVTSKGWYVDKTKSSYSINLSSAPADAKYVEILSYAIDDYGNVGFFNKVVRIAEAEDTDLPTLYKVVNVPESSYEAPDTITLPTLYFKDNKVEYMHADVTVYKVTANEKRVMQSSGMSTSFDSARKIYTVDGGIFNASTEGNYQVAVTVKDSGNHSVTTYFDYIVVGGQIIEDPEIENISAESKNMAIDESLYFVPPRISVTESSSYGYVGLNEEGDMSVATNYIPSVISNGTNNYELDQYYFVPKAKGTYKLQYNVFLYRYSTTALEAGTVKVVDGELIYVEGGVNYHVYYEKDSKGEYKLHFNSDPYLSGEDTELKDTTNALKVVKGFNLKSNVQTINVDTVVVKSLSVGDAYQKTQYTTTGENLPIVKPEVVVSGKGGVNKKDSTVQISLTTGNTTQTLATINFEEWQSKVTNNEDFIVDGSNISLKLAKNGRYTIRYSVQAQDEVGQNVGDPKTLEYVISNGDVIAPEITFSDDVVQETYKLGEDFVLNFAGISVSDKGSEEKDPEKLKEQLLSTITVRLTNEDTDESWTLENTAEEGKYSFEHNLKTAGDYTVTITIRDVAGNRAEKSLSFKVANEKKDPVNVKEVLGGVLIGVSVAILVGVVAYFVISKVKLDKKEKSYTNNKKNK